MNEIRDILVGIDFGREQTQICYYDRKAEEPLCVPVKVGTSQYEFPTCICKRLEREDWYFGKEAEYFAKEHDGIFIDNLYDICQGEEPVIVADQEMQPWELMGIFVEKMLKMLGNSDPVIHIKCLVITVEELTKEVVNNLQKVCDAIGFPKGKYMLQDYCESFYYHTLSQKQEYWSRSVAWFAFATEGVIFRKLSMKHGVKPILVSISEPVEQQLSTEDNMRDMEFYQFIQNTMGTEIYSSIFITGQGFQQEWAGKSIPLLCKQKRKVFFGNNLFAKGACYTAKEKLENRNLKTYLYAGDSLVRMNIGMDMMVMGSPAFYDVLLAGSNWYESSGSLEMILDDREELVFTLGSMETGEKKRVAMGLPGLPTRPNQTTRLLLELTCQSANSCKVLVKDLGFGDMYPSTGRTWVETIEW